jgi:hypothetical protein
LQHQKCVNVPVKGVSCVSSKVRLSPLLTRGRCVFGVLSRKWRSSLANRRLQPLGHLSKPGLINLLGFASSSKFIEFARRSRNSRNATFGSLQRAKAKGAAMSIRTGKRRERRAPRCGARRYPPCPPQ